MDLSADDFFRFQKMSCFQEFAVVAGTSLDKFHRFLECLRGAACLKVFVGLGLAQNTLMRFWANWPLSLESAAWDAGILGARLL